MLMRDGQHALILGLGISGLAMARWCARAGVRVTVADTRQQPPQLALLAQQLPQAQFISGPLTADLLDAGGGARVDVVLRSPGLAPGALQPLLQAARAQGIAVAGEIDLFAQALAQLRQERAYAPRVLAVTGTNGKTTVTALTALLTARAGLSTAVAGNIGPTLLDTLGQALADDALPEVWVLELSSFQLDAAAHDFEPTAAAVLNITQDHLDWHGDMDAYAAAKARVFGSTGTLVLGRDDARVAAMAPPVEKGKFGRVLAPAREVLTFGAGQPARCGDFGIASAGGMRWLARALPADESARRGKGGADEALHVQHLMPVDALRIHGGHNALNALAALALASCAGCALAPMLYGLREYRGEPHRVESIGVLDGVEYFDDSKGTNVGATVAALDGLGADGRKLVVILGGDGKGQDFAPLAGAVRRTARAVLLIGRDAPRIRAALAAQHASMPVLDAPDLPQAVQLAAAQAQPGDALVLSPACASLDMFRDYAHRAQVFRAAVQDLATGRGQILGEAA
jgi:UDP-N-acetylmuramoylalanine--D-glutamate ligase